jgi:hypothetical protein
MNTTQTALIKLVHADALEMTKHNAEQVLALYGAMMEFSQSTPQVAPETEADLDALEEWLTKAIGEDRIAAMLAPVHITQRIERALDQSRSVKGRRLLLGPQEAGELFAWLMEQPRNDERFGHNTSVNDIEGMTYNGVTIRLVEKAGIEVI